jgi:hypothetical protein
MTPGNTTCTRNKTINAVASMTGTLNRCTRAAKQLRSDGRAFCNTCARVEMNRLHADRFTWTTTKEATK